MDLTAKFHEFVNAVAVLGSLTNGRSNLAKILFDLALNGAAGNGCERHRDSAGELNYWAMCAGLLISADVPWVNDFTVVFLRAAGPLPLAATLIGTPFSWESSVITQNRPYVIT